MHWVARAYFFPRAEQRGRLAGDARAGGAERMAEGDGAAVEVELRLVEAELVDHQASDCEAKASLSSTTSMSFELEAGARQRLARRLPPGRCP
jgi:hypothetical protein